MKHSMTIPLRQMTILLSLSLFFVHYSLYAQSPKRIISLSGALSETVVALGYGDRLVATDVTSIYPASVKKLPRVSKNRQLTAEGILSFRPDLVLAPEGDIGRELQYQLKSAGVRLVTFRQQYSIKGASIFIQDVSKALGNTAKGAALVQAVEQEIQSSRKGLKTASTKPKVLFIYARGAGLMTVAGRNSNMDAIITLAGGENAIKEFTDFKPFSTEALVRANPDVILLFDFGLESLGGASTVLRLPGMSGTKAGKNKRIVEVDGQLMVNFSVRLAEAIRTLNNLLIR